MGSRRFGSGGRSVWFMTVAFCFWIRDATSFGAATAVFNLHKRQGRFFPARPLGAIRVRDWEGGDFPEIWSIVSSSGVMGAYDPEGYLESDCYTANQLKQSYPTEDGFFLVALDGAKVVGTVGVVIGTQVTYLQSGASMSNAKLTGAVRRLCGTQEGVLEALLREVESRGRSSGVTDLIALAYPEVDGKPDPSFMNRQGYVKANVQMGGSTAVQMIKTLLPTDPEETTVDVVGEAEGTSETSVVAALGTMTILGALIWVFLGVASLMGLDLGTSVASNNRGMGTPLSSEELGRLIQDESLKRTGLEIGQDDVEGVQEYSALMKIMSGQNVRLK